MKYRVKLTDRVIKQLKKMDKHTSALIIGWIEKNIEGCENPRIQGKGLTSNRTGQWRYRIGDYRLICEIYEEEVTILVLEVGHRRNIYDKKYLFVKKYSNQFIIKTNQISFEIFHCQMTRNKVIKKLRCNNVIM